MKPLLSTFILFSLLLSFQHATNAQSGPDIIFDTDLGGDADDLGAVLYAVKGRLGTYWEKVEGGYCKVEPDGDNKWVDGPPTNQSYLKLTADPEKVAEEIERVMLGK